MPFARARLGAIVLPVVSAAALAQPAIELPPRVVTATRYEQPLTEVLADVSTVELQELQRAGASTLTEVLARLPGLQTTTHADAPRVFIRGAEARMTALYIDGVRVDAQDGLTLGGGAPWDLVPLALIERIEVLRGPASAVYGSAAMGGVVQVFTRQGQGAFAPWLQLGWGSHQRQRLGAGVSGGEGAWTYALGLGAERTDGYDTRPDLVHTPTTEGSTQRAASLRLGYRWSEAHRLGLQVLDQRQHSRYVPWAGGADIDTQGQLRSASAHWAARWNPDYSTRLTLSQATVAKSDDAPNDYRTASQAAAFENRLQWGRGQLSVLLDVRRDAFDAQPSAWDPLIQGERTQQAYTVGYGAAFGRQAVELFLRSDHDSVFGSYPTSGLAYAYSPNAHWRVSASAGTAFRAPTLEQTVGPYGSTRLQPETNQSSELALRYTHVQSQARLVYYRNEIRDLISSSMSLTTCSAGFFCYYNVGKASIEGVTLSGQHRLGVFELQAALDLLDPRDEVSGKQLSLRARRMLSLGVQAEWLGAQWGLQWRQVGARFDDAANTQVLDAYERLDLSATGALGKAWGWQVRLDNVQDVRFQEVGRYATPGRTFFMGLQWQLAR